VRARLESRTVSWLYLALLAAAVVVLAGAEWPRLAGRFGLDARRRRERERRKKNLRVLHGEEQESEEFARSVERDLAKLPTIEERDRS
jgi:hypothetical protein